MLQLFRISSIMLTSPCQMTMCTVSHLSSPSAIPCWQTSVGREMASDGRARGKCQDDPAKVWQGTQLIFPLLATSFQQLHLCLKGGRKMYQ
ncbi:hypothetical protein M5D96_000424, partial [Drosophila gunungcola]